MKGNDRFGIDSRIYHFLKQVGNGNIHSLQFQSVGYRKYGLLVFAVLHDRCQQVDICLFLSTRKGVYSIGNTFPLLFLIGPIYQDKAP